MVLGFMKRGPGSVGCYGKLPRHGDYVSHASDGPEARFLSSWFDKGYLLTPGRDNPDAAEVGFLVRGRKRGLVGVFWPSGDASGTRRFPFALFAPMPTKTLAQCGDLVTVGIAPAVVEMARAFPGIREAAGIDQIHGLLSRIPISTPPSVADIRSEFGREAGRSLSAAAAMPVLFEVLRFAAALGGGNRGEAPNFAVRIPLRTEYAPSAESAAWLSILSERLGDSGMTARSHLFIRRAKGSAEGEMFVVHRDLKHDDLGFVLIPSDEYPYGNILGNEGEDPDVAAFVAELTGKVSGNFTLSDLVNEGTR